MMSSPVGDSWDAVRHGANQGRHGATLAMVPLLALVLLIALGCARTPSVTADEVVGTYEVSYGGSHGWGSDRLVLKPDGTFDEIYTLDTGRSYPFSGRWAYEVKNGEPIVGLDQAVILASEERNLLPGDWELKARRTKDGILLDREDPDHFIKLRKVDP